MVNRMRSNRSHTGHRRSHHALDDVRLSKCANCGAMHKRHTMCEKCGNYRGRKVIDMTALVAKETAKNKKKTVAAK